MVHAWLPYRDDEDTAHHYRYAKGEMNIDPLLDWITEEVQKSVKLLEQGHYMEYVESHFPLRYREGSISRRNYWKYVPSDIKRSFGNLDLKVKKEFLKWVKEHQDDQPTVENFTSGDYFRTSKIYYEIKGLIREDERNLTPRELYLRHSDGRCGKLTDLDIDSATEFADWLRNGSYEHHAFEIDYAHKWLRPCEKDGKIDFSLTYYLDEENAELIADVMKMVNRGVPMGARHFTYLAKEISGCGKYNIVPPCYDSKRWLSHEELLKRIEKKEPLSENRRLPYDAPEELVDKIKWKPLPKVEMKKTNTRRNSK